MHARHARCCDSRSWKANITSYQCACLCNAMDVTLSPFVSKFQAKQEAKCRAPGVRVPATLLFATSSSDVHSSAILPLLRSRTAPALFKANHFSGGILLIPRDQNNRLVCLKPPCSLEAAPPAVLAALKATKQNDIRIAGKYGKVWIGALQTASEEDTVAVLRSACAFWLSHRYGQGQIEGRLYSAAPRGCMLEVSIVQDVGTTGDIKVFCFHGTCAFAMVATERFVPRGCATRSAQGACAEEMDAQDNLKGVTYTRAWFTIPSWTRLKMYQASKSSQYNDKHPMIADSWSPSFNTSRVNAEAEALAAGFASVRVDFLFHQSHVYFVELTFAHGRCTEGLFIPGGLEMLYGQMMAGERRGESFEAQQLAVVKAHEETHVWHCIELNRSTGNAQYCRWVPLAKRTLGLRSR